MAPWPNARARNKPARLHSTQGAQERSRTAQQGSQLIQTQERQHGDPTPAQLEARLKYFVPRLNASVARLEKHDLLLSEGAARLPKKRWFAALLRARDALEYHANGDLRGLIAYDASRFWDFAEKVGRGPLLQGGEKVLGRGRGRRLGPSGAWMRWTTTAENDSYCSSTPSNNGSMDEGVLPDS